MTTRLTVQSALVLVEQLAEKLRGGILSTSGRHVTIDFTSVDDRDDTFNLLRGLTRASTPPCRDACHSSHALRRSAASDFDFICTRCGARDEAGNGWGALRDPCAAAPEVCHASHVLGSSDTSTFDFVCRSCGAHDDAGSGWGALRFPCTGAFGDETP